MGFEPMNTGFADQRVNHFAIGAHSLLSCCRKSPQREFHCFPSIPAKEKPTLLIGFGWVGCFSKSFLRFAYPRTRPAPQQQQRVEFGLSVIFISSRQPLNRIFAAAS